MNKTENSCDLSAKQIKLLGRVLYILIGSFIFLAILMNAKSISLTSKYSKAGSKQAGAVYSVEYNNRGAITYITTDQQEKISKYGNLGVLFFILAGVLMIIFEVNKSKYFANLWFNPLIDSSKKDKD